MSRWLLILVAGSVGWPVCARGAEPALLVRDGDSDESDVQDLIYFGGERPLFIRLHLQRDGRSFRAAWREFGTLLFKELDADQNGLLTGAEWEKIPSPDFLVSGNTRGAPQGAESVRTNIDVNPADGQITPAEFADYLLQVGAGPFTVQNDSFAAGPSTAAANQLFDRFDADRDGKLSRDELSHSMDLLKQLDRDDDEVVSRAELELPNARFTSVQSPSPPRSTSQFSEIGSGKQLEPLIQKLLNDLGQIERAPAGEQAGNREPGIPVGKLGLAATQVMPFDSDASGTLDQRELRRLLTHGAWSVEITIRNGTVPPGRSAVEVLVRGDLAGATVRPTSAGGMSLVLPGIEFLFHSDPATAGSALENLLRLFKAADMDNNGYLERKETTRNPFFGQAFDSLDLDGDGKLFESEVKTYIDGRETAARSRTALAIRKQANNFFNMLDVNQDGRLGVRELADASNRAMAWDHDGDDAITPGEVPQLYQLRIGRDQPQLPGALPVPMIRAAPGEPAADGRRGPEWFRRMDRNRDGDISRREFLGPRDLFERLDRDRDGLVSMEESERKP